jgi:murein DD-endopeptidase MepM/ murein hydrolase activator NlpD
MNTKRAHLIWIPQGGVGKVRATLMHPVYLRILFSVLLICVISIPLLEWGVLSLNDEIRELEAKKELLSAEIERLEYVKQALAEMSLKEEELKAYFGMSRYRSLRQALGGATVDPPGVQGGLKNASMVFDKSDLVSSIPMKIMREKFQNMSENFDALGELMMKQSAAWENTPSVIPVKIKEPKISSGFGWRTNPFTNKREFHAGIDIIGRTGMAVIAPARGVVANTGYDRWLGKYLVVRHTDEIRTIYGHLNKVLVKKGEKVQRGETIGQIGNTGLSTSSHLHYSVVEEDRVVDPMLYILDFKG